ncbi:MAG: CBS domain-containing protein [Methanomassiliicoccaceae archaeon]|jgi:CBS domain-containing protein|nr:CBS domain-containing protein [Euryarchaeota archaeon]HOB38777.1 CBS domain-containing protein [Methanomassiliicoccaceae archaeon]HOL06803.1 CBS domain-containing protein [Methanomassiliicoccaceae archaeon]HQA21501.1 CBS domain-containing protein [Methanomassiliicoccaceae archaeon]HQD88526.1 CBS domain-containing protein [Methanomassiliicoccaceae archaeon]
MPYTEKKFSELLVGDVAAKLVQTAATVGPKASIREVIEKMIANPLSRKVYVVDEQGRYIGTVNTETILRLIGYRVGVRKDGGISFMRFLLDALKEEAGHIMVKGSTVCKDTKLTTALDIMVNEHLNDLPVVDENGVLIGELNSLELFEEGKILFDAEPGA